MHVAEVGSPIEFRAGTNIAVKVPAGLHEATVAFYRDTVGLAHLGSDGTSEVFGFGGCRLWLDRVEHATHAEVWLELTTDDVDAGAEELRRSGARVADELEPLGDVQGHWIVDPGGTVLLLSRTGDDAGVGMAPPGAGRAGA
jgi:hypothetical protein